MPPHKRNTVVDKTSASSLVTLPSEILSMIANRDPTYLLKDPVSLDDIVHNENLRRVSLKRKGRPKNNLSMVSKQLRDVDRSEMSVDCKKGEFAFPLSVPSWNPSLQECVPPSADLRLDALQHVAPDYKNDIQGKECKGCDSRCKTEGELQHYLLACLCSKTADALGFDFYPSSRKARWIANAIKVRKNISLLHLKDNSGEVYVNPDTRTLEEFIPYARGIHYFFRKFQWNLSFNRVITNLNLGHKQIGKEGAIAIAEALKVNAVLTNLRLFDNNIGDAGAAALGEALKVNAALNTLELQSNKISDAGATALADALKVNAALTNLDLKHNPIGDVGAVALGEGIKVNAVLQKLEIGLSGPSR